METMEYVQERRNGRERRSGVDRRKLRPGRYTGVERRVVIECRSGDDRRAMSAPWTELQERRVG